MLKKPLFLQLSLLILVGCFASGCVSGSSDTEVINRVDVGTELPSFVAEGPFNNTFICPDDLKGKRAAILIFTTYCGDCKVVFRDFEKLWKATEDGKIENFELIAINRGEDAYNIETYWKSEGMTMEYYYDFDKKIWDKFANIYVPRLYLVGTDGIVKKMWIEKGLPTYEEMLNEIDKL